MKAWIAAALIAAGAATAQTLDQQAAAQRQAEQLVSIDKAWADKARAAEAKIYAPAPPPAKDSMDELVKVLWVLGALAAAGVTALAVSWFKVRKEL